MIVVVVNTDSGFRLATLLRPGLIRLEGLELAVPTASYTRLDHYRGAALTTLARALTWATAREVYRA